MSWRTRIRLLLSRVKWPGWVMFLLGVLWWTPEVYGKVDFWMKVAKAVGGNFELIATVTASPWFSIFLMLVGMLWLCFVGESRYAIRHPAMPYIGWGFVILLVLAFWTVLVAGYVATHIPQQMAGEATAQIDSLNQAKNHLQQKVEALGQALEQQAAPWVLTDDQREKLREVLNNVPLDKTYTIHVHVIAGCNVCSVYADDLIAAWDGIPRWEIHGSTNFNLSSRLVGVNVGYDPAACPSGELELIKKAFDAAGISGKGFPYNDKDKERLGVPCGVFVGSKPQK